MNELPLHGLIIGVDLDGVFQDFYERMREIASEWFEVPVESLTRHVSYGLREWAVRDTEQYESLHRFAVTQRDLFSTSPMIPGARRYLRILSDEGARVRIITHRLFISYFHRAAVAQTIDWLDNNGIPYWDLCFMKAKEQVGRRRVRRGRTAERGEPSFEGTPHDLLRKQHKPRWATTTRHFMAGSLRHDP